MNDYAVALFKVAKQNKFHLPHPLAHMYLASLLQETNDDRNIEINSNFYINPKVVTMKINSSANVVVLISVCLSVILFILVLECSDDSNSVSSQRYSKLSDSSFVVSDSSVLEINNFAVKVDVTPGNPDVVHVVAEKWAGQQADLDKIEVELAELQNGVRVRTTNPLGLNNVSVDL